MKKFFTLKIVMMIMTGLIAFGASAAVEKKTSSTKEGLSLQQPNTANLTGLVTDASKSPFLKAKKAKHQINLPSNVQRTFKGIKDATPKTGCIQKVPAKTTEELINLSFHAVMDEAESIQPSSVLLINAENVYDGYFGKWPEDLPEEEWETFEPDYTLANLSVAPGTYDMMYEFWTSDGGPTIGRVIKENVIIDGSETDITCDFNEATRRITFRPVLPDGSEMKLYTYHWLDEEPWYEIVEEGNIYDQYTMSQIIHKDYGIVVTFFGNCGVNDDYNPDALSTFDFLVNQGISDKYIFRKLLCVPLPNGDNLNILLSTEGEESDYITCNSEDYYIEEHEMLHTPAYGNWDLDPNYGTAFEMGVMDYGVEQGGFSGARTSDSKIYDLVNVPYSTEQMALYSSYTLNDLTQTYIIDWGDGYTEEGISYYGTSTPNFIHNGEASEYYYGPTSLYRPAYDYDFVNYPTYEDFSFMPSESNLKMGESPVVFTVCYLSYNAWWDENVRRVESDVTYTGYLGEQRWTDYALAEISAKFNGEDFLDLDYDLSSAFYYWGEEYPEAGVIELEFKNDNVEVDGLPGHNYAKLTANYRNEDDNVPVIQALTMRNTKDNQIDCRFENPEDGKIIFTGADFNINIELDGYYLNTWMDEEPMNVVVEYAPYGTGDWEELPYAIYEEKHKDCWGSFYSAPLAHVNRQSETGWFDLRLSLTDEAGNSNVQEISPAFRIASLATSGVKAINTDSSEAIYYTIDGRRAYGALTPGIYVKIADGKAQKVTIK